MSRTTNDSDDGMVSKDQVDSPSIDEGNNAGGSVGGIVLKKGPWTSAEDAILVDYVKKHGEGNWNAVQKHSGLFRCGKSCRLRWANHLRPNLKKGAFTPEEERLIIELHAKMGNKWARMAAHLPGRTDNEIKNYWNTRIKRLQRAGLPLYPPDVCLQALNDAQQNQNASEFSSEDIQPHDLLQSNGFDIPDVVFENYHVNMGTFPYGTEFQEIPVNGMFSQGLVPAQSYSFMPPTVPLTKKIREETLHPSFSGIICDELSPFQQFQNEGCEKIRHRPFGLGNSFPFDPDPNDKNFAPITGVTTGSHGLFHGNISASKSLVGTVKRELPSLQYPDTDLSTWANICPPSSPSLEAVDTYIQSPSQTGQMQSDSASPCNSGLLDALLQQAQTLHGERNQFAEKRSASVVTPADFMDSTELNESETEWEYGDPISPLGRSAASVFSECTPPISGSSLDEPPHDKAMFRPGILKNSVEPVTTPDGEREISTHMDFTRPDALLNADWFHQSECMKDIEPFLNEVYCGDYKHLASGTTSNHSQGWGIASYPWNNMPAVCHISENP